MAAFTRIDLNEEEPRRVDIQRGRHQLVSKPRVGNDPPPVIIPAGTNAKSAAPPDQQAQAAD